MSGLEVIGAISAVLNIVDGIAKVWNTARRDIKFSKNFETAASKVFVLHSILKSCESSLQRIAPLPQGDDKRLADVMRACEANVKKLETIFNETISGGKDKWYERYKTVLKKLGTGCQVEELTLLVVEDTKTVATYHQVLSLSPDLGRKLDHLAKELRALQPSTTEDLANVYTFNNTGDGQQYVNTGDSSTQLNNEARLYYQGSGNPTFNFGREHPQSSFAERLQFDGQYSREAQLNLSRANPNSFDWLWYSPFKYWVNCSNEKVFWITGKPGSGKSMCMKYISEHTFGLTSSLLRIRFFFNYAAEGRSSMSNTIDGLRRSILAQICEDVPELSPSITRRFGLQGSLLEERVFNSDMLSSITEFAFDELNRLERPIFLLLDGLDDYKGDLCEVTEVVQEFESKPAVLKLCVASRPHEFSTQFAGWPKLYLETYNKQAIFLHARSKLLRHCSPLKRHTEEGNLSKISEQVATKADGVFLWADLATRELCNLLRKNADMEEHEELLRSVPAELTEYYEKLILGLGSDMDAWTTVFKLVASVRDEMWLSCLYEACYHLNLRILKHDGFVTQEKLQKFMNHLYYQTGGLLTFLQHQCRPEQISESGENETDEDEGDHTLIEVRLVHRSLKDFLGSDDGWTKLFGSERSHTKGSEAWLSIAEAVFSKPLKHDARIAIMSKSVAHSGNFRNSAPFDPPTWPQFSLEASSVGLAEYVDEYLPVHMFDYETETGSHVPLKLLQYLEQSGFAARHVASYPDCACVSVFDSIQHGQATTVPEILILHTCELTITQYIQKDLVILEAEQGTKHLSHQSSNYYANLSRGQSFLESAIVQWCFCYYHDTSDLCPSLTKAESLLRFITNQIRVIHDGNLLGEAIKHLTAEALSIVLENCVKPGPLILKPARLQDFRRYPDSFESTKHPALYRPLWFLGRRIGCDEEFKKVLEILLARGEDIKEDCGPSGTVVNSVLLRPRNYGCDECGPRSENNPIQELDLLACYGAVIEPAGPNTELCRAYEKWMQGEGCRFRQDAEHMCSIETLPRYLRNPAGFMEDHPEIQEQIRRGRENIGYQAASYAWDFVDNRRVVTNRAGGSSKRIKLA